MLNTGCPMALGPLCFCHFLGFWSTYRGPFYHFSTALEISYMIATRIFKFDEEMPEKIELKDSNPYFTKNISDLYLCILQFHNFRDL